MSNSEPTPPTNARLLVGDEVIPLKMVYDRQDESGTHIWTAEPVHLTAGDDVDDIRLQCDQMPAATYIEFDWRVSLP